MSTVSAVRDTPKMVFCPKCFQIMAPSVENGRMVYVCDSDQHSGKKEMEPATSDNICVYKVGQDVSELCLFACCRFMWVVVFFFCYSRDL